MTAAWSPAELQEINAARELEIASRRADGTLRRWVPIWAVSTGGLVYVRTWYRRETGWFGHVLASRRARIRVPGLEADVEVEDVGEGTPDFALASARLTRPSTGAEAALSGWYQPKPQLPHCGLAQKTGHKPPLSNNRGGGTGEPLAACAAWLSRCWPSLTSRWRRPEAARYRLLAGVRALRVRQHGQWTAPPVAVRGRAHPVRACRAF